MFANDADTVGKLIVGIVPPMVVILSRAVVPLNIVKIKVGIRREFMPTQKTFPVFRSPNAKNPLGQNNYDKNNYSFRKL